MTDIVRLTVLCFASLLCGMCLVISALYGAVYRKAGGGLVPLHVTLIALSYSLLTVGIAWGQIVNVGNPPTPPTFIIMCGGAVGIVALFAIARVQAEKLERL